MIYGPYQDAKQSPLVPGEEPLVEASHVSATGMPHESSGSPSFSLNLTFQMCPTAELVFPEKKSDAIVLKLMKNPDKDDVLFYKGISSDTTEEEFLFLAI